MLSTVHRLPNGIPSHACFRSQGDPGIEHFLVSFFFPSELPSRDQIFGKLSFPNCNPSIKFSRTCTIPIIHLMGGHHVKKFELHFREPWVSRLFRLLGTPISRWIGSWHLNSETYQLACPKPKNVMGKINKRN